MSQNNLCTVAANDTHCWYGTVVFFGGRISPLKTFIFMIFLCSSALWNRAFPITDMLNTNEDFKVPKINMISLRMKPWRAMRNDFDVRRALISSTSGCVKYTWGWLYCRAHWRRHIKHTLSLCDWKGRTRQPWDALPVESDTGKHALFLDVPQTSERERAHI